MICLTVHDLTFFIILSPTPFPVSTCFRDCSYVTNVTRKIQSQAVQDLAFGARTTALIVLPTTSYTWALIWDPACWVFVKDNAIPMMIAREL